MRCLLDTANMTIITREKALIQQGLTKPLSKIESEGNGFYTILNSGTVSLVSKPVREDIPLVFQMHCIK